MNEQEIKQTLTTVLQMSEKESMAAKKSTRPGTWHIGKITGNRLNKSLLRSQFIVCESKADWDNSESDACKALHSDQRVFVQVDDDVWDVYAGAPLNSESSEPVIIAQNKIGLNDLLTETKAELLHSTNSTVSSGGAGEGVQENILAAIRTKPFILLAGISGTGKSRMVRQLARGCCPEYKDEAKTQKHPLYNEQKPGNFEMIPVRPNWHDSTELMGYVTRISSDNKPQYVLTPFVHFLVKAWLHPDVPFFLCLDEMNLAPVEQYFAEYLSVIETRKTVGGKIVTDPLVTFPNEALRDQMLNELYAEKAGEASTIIEMFKNQGGIPIPQNFIVMGTVNMDETTFSFSRKVLDRAMSFELNEVDMDDGLASDPDCKFGSIGMAAAKCEFTQGFEVYAAAKDACDTIKVFLVEVNKVLDKTPFKIAYRTRNEIMIYCHERAKGGVPLAQALDEATSMKILSRVEGDKRRLVVRDDELPEYNGKPLLDSLLKVILNGLKTVRGGDGDYTESDVCSRKLKEMMSQLENGYTSFWTR
jgi:hypothetical protein